MTQLSPPLSPRQTLPTMYDLPSEEIGDPGAPDEFHVFQPELLRQTFRPPAYDPQEVFTAADLNLYYDLRHPQWYKRPDWFAVLGLPRLYERGHWLPTPEEAERQRADSAEAELQRLRRLLAEAGVNPESAL